MEMYPIVESENGKLMIKGYCERRYIHKMGLKHTTSLIMPVLSYDEGRILTVDKCEKYIAEALAFGDPAPVAQMSVDIFGGHLEYSNLTEEEKSTGIISEDMMKRNAVRRVEERILTKSDDDYVNITVNPSKMKFVGIYECHSEHNNEIGYVYTYELAPGDYIAEIVEYTEESETTKLRLNTYEFLLSELSYMNSMLKNGKLTSYTICDGLSRLLEANDYLYEAVGIKKPENGKNGNREPGKYNINVDIYIPSNSENSGQIPVKHSEESFFGTKRQADERGRQLVKQMSGLLGGSYSDSSYWLDEM